MNVRIRLRPGIYWDEHNTQRECAIVEVRGRLVTALDMATRTPIADPTSAIPVERDEPEPP